MKRIHMAVLAAAGLCVATTTPAAAQGLRYGVNAGLLMPMSDYNTVDKPGWVAGVGATKWLTGNAIGIRLDGSYSQTSHDAASGFNGHSTIAGGMASLVYGLMPATASARPFLTGGIGYYNVKFEDGGVSNSESKVGFGLGAGVSLKMGTGNTRLIVATRYTSVSTTGTSTAFLPITVGLSFGK
jgi:opacity protein-like surface antigen